MKKKIILTLLLVSSIMLAACGSTGTDGFPNPQQADGTVREIPLSTKLAIGTLKLEETDFAIASDQASNLLPLWQVLSSLTESDSAAQEEINAIVEQIQETMTPDQLKAIDDMSITGENMFTTLQEMNLVPQFAVNGTPQPRGNFPEGGFPGGGGPGGGPGSGGGPGGFGGDGGQLTPNQITTAQARRSENGDGSGFSGSNRMLAPLIEAVIKLLESKQ